MYYIPQKNCGAAVVRVTRNKSRFWLRTPLRTIAVFFRYKIDVGIPALLKTRLVASLTWKVANLACIVCIKFVPFRVHCAILPFSIKGPKKEEHHPRLSFHSLYRTPFQFVCCSVFPQGFKLQIQFVFCSKQSKLVCFCLHFSFPYSLCLNFHNFNFVSYILQDNYFII